MVSGIYLITCTENQRRYVGSAQNIVNRWKDHRLDLIRGRHHNRHLQRSWNKYGEAAFEWAILEVIDESITLLAREQFWIDTLHPEFNISPFANRPTNKGYRMSDDARARIAESNRRVWAEMTEEQRKARGVSATHPHSEETKLTLRRRTREAYASGKLSRVRVPHSDDTKGKIRIARARQAEQQIAETARKRAIWELGREEREHARRAKVAAANTGRQLSEETKEKLRLAATLQMNDPEMQEKHRAATKEAMQRPEVQERHRKGIANRPPMSDEHRQHIGDAHRGMKRPEGTGEKIAASKRGKKRSPETIEKLKIAQQARWARHRAEKDKQKE